MANISESINMKGWVKLKSQKVMGGYNNKYFQIKDGDCIMYGNDEKELENNIPIQLISSIERNKDIKFKIIMKNKDKEYIIKVKNNELREKWVEAIQMLVGRKAGSKGSYSVIISEQSNKSKESDNGQEIKERKNSKVNKENRKLIYKVFEKFGKNNINSSFLSKEEIKTRYYSGFLKIDEKEIEEEELNEKKNYWVLLFSSRPLFTTDYEEDDRTINDIEIKEWLKLDNLYFFNPEEELKIKKSLNLLECNSISYEDKESIHCIMITFTEKKYFMYFKSNEERKLWSEILKNSNRTINEIGRSITKHPRNMAKLLKINKMKGENGYFSELDKEIKNLNNLEIEDFDTLFFELNELEKKINEILDGLLLFYKEKKRLFELTVDYFINMYLEIVNSFWDNNYTRFDNEKLIKLSRVLFDFGDSLLKFGIDDENIYKNANEYIKIYIKKLYNQILESIPNILKNEREKKQYKTNEGVFLTKGPDEFFFILSHSVLVYKDIKIPFIHSYILNMLYEGIAQYVDGTECFATIYNFQVESEFLLAIANNSVNILLKLQDFINKYKESNRLTEKRINEEIHMNSILKSINLLTKNVITRFVVQLSKDIVNNFKCNYNSLDLKGILDKTLDIFFKYNDNMYSIIKELLWEEIFELILKNYINLFMTTSAIGEINKEKLLNQITKDKQLLETQQSVIFGKNKNLFNLQIFEDIKKFLECKPNIIVEKCISIKKYCGNIFDIQIIGKLLRFRMDLSDDDIKRVLNECKNSFNNKKINTHNFNGNLNENNSFNYKSKKNLLYKLYKLEKGKSFLFEDFIDEEGIKVGIENMNDKKEDNLNIIKINNNNNVIMEGRMEEKKLGSFKKYQIKYYKLRNGYLYVYLNEKCQVMQNRIDLKNILKIKTYCPKKFVMIIESPNEEKTGRILFKFKTKDEKSKSLWINTIKEQIKKIKGEFMNNIIYITEKKKKKIKDFLDLPVIGTERNNVNLKITSTIKEENKLLINNKDMNSDLEETRKISYDSICCESLFSFFYIKKNKKHKK